MAVSGNLTYLGSGGNSPVGSPAQGQVIASNDAGPLAKIQYGYVTLTGDGAATTATINFIDGVQKIGQVPVVLPMQSVTAPATLNGVANQAIYSGVGSIGQIPVGASVTFAGFANGGNNGTFTVNAITTTGIQVTNASSVAETNYASTVTFTKGPAVLGVQVSRSGNSADTMAASVYPTTPTAVSNVSFTCNFSATLTVNTITLLVAIIFAS